MFAIDLVVSGGTCKPLRNLICFMMFHVCSTGFRKNFAVRCCEENLMLRWEQARCLYALKSPEGMSIAKALAAECRQGIQGPRAGSSNWAAQVLSCSGLWLSESRLENADVIKKDCQAD